METLRNNLLDNSHVRIKIYREIYHGIIYIDVTRAIGDTLTK